MNSNGGTTKTTAHFSTLDWAAGPLTETTVVWGGETHCTVCLCDLNAGDTAYIDGDGALCNDCAEPELPEPTARERAIIAVTQRRAAQRVLDGDAS